MPWSMECPAAQARRNNRQNARKEGYKTKMTLVYPEIRAEGHVAGHHEKANTLIEA